MSNPSFEDIDSCYGSTSDLGFDVFQWSGCKNWYNPTYASSDLYCSNPVVGTDIPPNIQGWYQYPKTGSNMAGIVITETTTETYREYIQNQLLATLETNKYYELRFYVNSAETSNYSSDIGVYFSNNPITQNKSYSNLLLIPQIKNPAKNFITDTAGWQMISGIYKAIGGEKYITIGCFNDSTSIILSSYDQWTAGGVYLFVDDFSVEEISTKLNIPNVFSPNNDGYNDVFKVDMNNVSNWKCSIYNRWGIKVFETTQLNDAWDRHTTSGILCSDGTYYYVFEGETEGQKIKENGFLQLLR